MKLTLASFFGFLILTPSLLQAAEPSTKLEVQGTPGLRFFGLCVSSDGYKERKIEGVSPSEIQLDTTIEKCSLKRGEENSTGKLTVRLFQNRKMIAENELVTPSSGIELLIPFGNKKRK